MTAFDNVVLYCIVLRFVVFTTTVYDESYG